MHIDLNADAGKSFGPWKLGQDEALFPLINISQPGLRLSHRRSIDHTTHSGPKNWAGSGSPPRLPRPGWFRAARTGGHARRDEVYTDALYQIGALSAFLRAAGELEARALGLRTVAKAFPKRGYRRDGRLAPRGTIEALIHDPATAARRAVQMVSEGQVEAVEGGFVPVRAQTFCIHGDNPRAVAIAKAVREALLAEGVAIQSY